MPAYVIALIDVSDMDTYKKYIAVSPGTIAQYDGKFIARGGRNEVVEGAEDNRRKVILEFPTYERALEWYHSPEYQAAIGIRKDAADGTFIVIEGLD